MLWVWTQAEEDHSLYNLNFMHFYNLGSDQPTSFVKLSFNPKLLYSFRRPLKGNIHHKYDLIWNDAFPNAHITTEVYFKKRMKLLTGTWSLSIIPYWQGPYNIDDGVYFTLDLDCLAKINDRSTHLFLNLSPLSSISWPLTHSQLNWV